MRFGVWLNAFQVIVWILIAALAAQDGKAWFVFADMSIALLFTVAFIAEITYTLERRR